MNNSCSCCKNHVSMQEFLNENENGKKPHQSPKNFLQRKTRKEDLLDNNQYVDSSNSYRRRDRATHSFCFPTNSRIPDIFFTSLQTLSQLNRCTMPRYHLSASVDLECPFCASFRILFTKCPELRTVAAEHSPVLGGHREAGMLRRQHTSCTGCYRQKGSKEGPHHFRGMEGSPANCQQSSIT